MKINFILFFSLLFLLNPCSNAQKASRMPGLERGLAASVLVLQQQYYSNNPASNSLFVSCNTFESKTVAGPLACTGPNTNLTVKAQNDTVCYNTGTNIIVSLPESGYMYQLRNNSDNSLIGTAIAGSGQSVSLPISNLITTTTFNILVTAQNNAACWAVLTVTPKVVVRSALPTSTPTSNSASDNPVCVGGTLRLYASPVAGATYTWTGPNNFTSTVQNPIINNVPSPYNGPFHVATVFGKCTSDFTTTDVRLQQPSFGAKAIYNNPACVGSPINLAASSPVTTASYQWKKPDGTSVTGAALNIPNASISDAGNYVLTVTDNTNLNCVVSDTAKITVNPIPPSPVASVKKSPLCTNDTLRLTASTITGASYKWTGPGITAGISGSQNPVIPGVTKAMEGTYSVTATVNGCTSPPASTTVQVNVGPVKPDIKYNTPLCTGDTIHLSTTLQGSGATYDWKGPLGVIWDKPNLDLPHASPGQNGYYKLQVSFTNGCKSVDSANITVYDKPLVPYIYYSSPLCAGDTIHLNTDPINGTYNWTGPKGFASQVQNPLIPQVATDRSGNYYLTITVNGCKSPKDSAFIDIKPRPTKPVISGASTVCAGDTIRLTGGASPATGLTYAWKEPNGSTSSALPLIIPHAALTNSGIYTLTATLGNCSSSASATVNVQAPVKAIASNTGPYKEGQTIQLNGSGGTSYQWTGPSSFSNTLQSPTIPNAGSSRAGMYYLKAISGPCTSYDSTKVIINLLPVIGKDTIRLIEDSTYNGDLATNDKSTDGPFMRYTLISQPSVDTVILNTDGSFSYKHHKNFNGTVRFKYQLCDGGTPEACITDTAVIIVFPVNDPPVVHNEIFTTTTSQAFTEYLDNGDNDSADGTQIYYNIHPVKNPANGSITIDSITGKFTYQAHAGFIGNDTTIVWVDDSGSPLPIARTRDTLIMIVKDDGNLSSPMVSNDTVSIKEDTKAVVTIIGPGEVDPDGTSLVIPSLVLPKHGTIAATSTGNFTYTYTPAANFSGKDTIIFKVCDSGTPSFCTYDTLFVTIAPVNDSPVVFNESMQTIATQVLNGTLANGDNDIADGTALSYSVPPGKSPAHGTIILSSNGNFSYTPNPSYAGPDTVIITVCDAGKPLPSLCVNDTLFIKIDPAVYIGVAKEAGEPVYVNDESFNITYKIHVKNYSNAPLSNLQVTDDLRSTFKGATHVKMVTTPMTTGSLSPNIHFDGLQNDSLLVTSGSMLAPKDTATIIFTINVKTAAGSYSNIAVASYLSNGVLFSDTSIAGTNPDPNGNQNATDPGEQGGTLITLPEVHLTIPEGFSPNGDGINDYFEIVGLERYPNNSIKIFNRWGSLLFEKEKYASDWDGTSSGKLDLGNKPLPASTCFYLLNLGDAAHTVIKGYIYINP